MSSTQVTNLDLSEPQEGLYTEEIPEKTNDITANAEGQGVTVSLNEERPKDKDIVSTVEEQEKQEEQEQLEEIVDKQQKDVENDSARKESNQEELNKEDSTTINVNANETKQILEENNDQATLSGWSAVWDDNAQAYYYWNTITNETTWENPNNINNNDLTAQISNSEYTEYTEQDYHQYYYSQYGYYPEAYHYGYDNSTLAASSGTATTAMATTEPPTNPLDSLLDKIDKEVKSKLDGDSSKTKSSSSTSDSQYNDQQEQTSSADFDQYQTKTNDPDYQSFLAEHGGNDGGADYKFTARFNARTGKFQRDPTLNPEKFSADAKAIRQMSYFFDYDQFAESRGSAAANKRLSSEASLDDSIRSHKKLNKKDIEMFKQKKKEKKEMKKKSWLLSDD